jgi:hypothetical protein
MRELQDAAHLLHSRHLELRERFDRDGCLLLRGLLDPAAVEDLRRQVLELHARRGWTNRAPNWIDPHAGRLEYHADVQRLEAFHRLGHDPALLGAARALLGDEVFVHPRRLLRTIWVGAPGLTTPPHQDFQYIRGACNTITAWVPLGSCRREDGGLRLLVGSHESGELPVQGYAGGLNAYGVAAADDDPGWASADYASGDAVIFHSLLVHGALPNRSDRPRLSVDYRYQPSSAPVAESSLRPADYPRIPDWSELLAGVPWRVERWLSVPEGVEVVE